MPHSFSLLDIKSRKHCTRTKCQTQPVIIDVAPRIPAMTTKIITAFADHPPERNTTVTVTPLEKFTEAVIFLISHSMSIIIEKKVAVKVTNTTE